MSEDEDFRRGVRPRSDSSSSDGSVGPSNSRNKRVRVAIESDGSESSGGPVSRRGRTRAASLRESDTDTSGWATDHSDAPMPTAPPRNDGFASDSSEGNSDKCSICLLRFTNQEIGVPQTCEHYFCLDCITEWSKNVNTCPVDRKEFDAIVVKLCVGGPVLRTEPVHVAERRSSVDIVVVEEHTICQLCHSPESEETMLLCDGCDLGYHMACLEPPLITIPRGQWFCPYCISDSEDGDVPISEVTDLLDDLDNEGLAARPLPPRSHILRAPRNVRRSRRSRGADQPSSSRQRNSNITNEGSTSRSRKRTRKRVKGRPSRRVPGMLEDEVSSGRARTKKRRVRRKVVRTAARRAMVRGCVRARLASLRDQGVMRTDPTDINVSRHRAGILPLSIFGSQFELEYFGEGEETGGGGTVAMATRPTSHIISAYRQAQRKQITIPSPTHASTAPDILSSILESQSLLHSKGSIVSVSAGGQVNIKLIQKRPKNPGSIQPNVPKPTENEPIANKENADASGVKLDNKDDINKNVSDRVDLVKAGTSVNVKETPMHPSQSRGGGFNHQNNYRGHGNFNNGGRHYDNNYGGDFNRNSQGNSFQDNVYNDGNSFEGSYDRRPGFDGGYRPRRPYEENRPFQRFNEPGRHSFGPPWQTSNQNRNQYQNNPRPNIEPRARHSFGGLEDPLDMRTGPNNFPPSSSNNISIINSSNNISIINSSNSCAPTNTNIPPLREPPAFKFNVNTEVEKSEDENDGLVIDTEKYDPTEPTVDEESENEDEQVDLFPEKSADITESNTETVSEDIPLPQEPVPNESLDKPVNISAAALDDAVRQVIRQHSRLLTNEQDSDEEDTGDCPNFSIYSATSVHIAQTTNIEDTPAIETANLSTAAEVIKPPDAYNVKISKKCPITPNTRTPIKIKINTPSLIKRVSLYDEEDEQEEEEVEEPPKETPNVIESPVEELTKNKNFLPVTNEVSVPDVEMENVKAKSVEREKSTDRIIQSLQIYDDDDKSDRTPIEDEKDSPIIENTLSNNDNYFKTPERDLPPSDDEKSIASNKSTKSKQSQSESDQGEQSDSCRPKTPKKKPPLEKMTESISETEDERSYTPCLDENKKENSIEADALQGLDTEMISEDEAQDTFLEIPKEQEVIEEAPKPEEEKEAPVKKKKKEVKEKKSKKKSESFKKSGKTKTRNYRDKDKNRSRSPSHEKGDKGKSKREKRKDLERYDVRNVVSEKRRRKDAFGRDIISPRRSGSPVSPTRKRRSSSPIRRSLSRPKRSVSRPHRSTSRVRRSISRTRRSISRTKRSLTPRPRRSPVRAGRSISRRRSISRLKRSLSRQIRSLSRQRRSLSRKRVSPPPRRHSPPFRRRSLSRGRVSPSRARVSPSRARGSPSRARVSPVRTRVSPARHKRRRSSSPHKRRVSLTSPTRDTLRKKKKSVSPRRKSSTRKEKRRKETELKTKPSKKKKRDRSQSKEKKRRNRKKSESPKRKSPKRKKKRRSVVEEPIMEVEPVWVWSGGSVASERSESRPPSPLTPPNPVLPQHSHHRHRRVRDPPPSKEVFTSGDNILVSVSFKDSNSTAALEERKRQRAERRLRRLAISSSSQPLQEPKPVAIIDLERSPFREITPEAVHVIVVSDGDKSPDERREPVGPKTPPESVCARAPPCLAAAPPGSTGGGAGGVSSAPLAPLAPLTPLTALPCLAAAQYDPFEPTRSPSISSNAGDKEVSGPTEAGLNAGLPEQDRLAITLETAQKTNMSADEVLDQRPISPIEKVMALLKSTRDVSLECVPASSPMQLPATPPPSQNPPTPPPVTPLPTLTTLPSVPAATPRVLLPSPSRSSPLRPQPSKLFLAKPSPIKSTPIKPMPATKISSLPLPVVRRVGEESPYSPASSDFGELFSPPGGKDAFDALTAKKKKSDASKVPVKRVKKKGGKHQVPVQLGDDNLKILDDLPSSAVEMQVKSKFLKKLNRQERVVEEVKLVLKPYYNRRRLSKDDYKDIMRRAVPKICHNKHGEINPTKIQSLVEAYVKKLRKKRKLGLS